MTKITKLLKEDDIAEIQFYLKESLQKQLNKKLNPKTSLNESVVYLKGSPDGIKIIDEVDAEKHQNEGYFLLKKPEQFLDLYNSDVKPEILVLIDTESEIFDTIKNEFEDSFINDSSLQEADEKDIKYWLTTKSGHKVPLDKDKKAIATVANGNIKKGLDFSKADVEEIAESILKEGLLRESYNDLHTVEKDVLDMYKHYKNAPTAIIWKDYDLEMFMWNFAKVKVGDIIKMGGEALGKVVKVIENPYAGSLTENEEVDETSEEYNDDYNTRSNLEESKITIEDVSDWYANNENMKKVKEFILQNKADIPEIYRELKKNYTPAISADFRDEWM